MQFRGRIQRKTWCMGPYAGVYYNLTLCPLQSRLLHIYHGQPMPESTLTLCQSCLHPPSQGLWIWPMNPSCCPSKSQNVTWLSNTVLFLLKNNNTSGFCPRVRAPVFLDLVPRPTGRCAPPTHRSFAASYLPPKLILRTELGPPGASIFPLV